MVASMSALVTCDFISWQHRKRRPWLALSGDSSGLLLLPEQLLQSQSHVALFDLGSILLLWLPWCLCMSHVTSKEVSSCLCTMIDSAYVNVQAAVDNYALGLSASLDTSLGPLPLGEDPQGQGSVARQSWTEWGGLFPTVGYIHNGFFDAVGPMLVGLLSDPASEGSQGISGAGFKAHPNSICSCGISQYLHVLMHDGQGSVRTSSQGCPKVNHIMIAGIILVGDSG